ncbi:MAG: ABC transporter ATP-binding protein [Candidatus Omnitrophica bacterium]|nr:ABC transporter ATP-binding protein [Candidatus Omnitrophota bacterium]
MNDNQKILEIKDLTLRIGGKCIVKNVSFKLTAGRVMALVGESGSGKTLTAQSILKLFPPRIYAEGSITFKGKNLFELDKEEIRKIRGCDISIVPQEPATSMNPVTRVGEQIAEGIRQHQERSKPDIKQRVLELLRMVKLDEGTFSSYPHELSGGARQRVLLAMALVLDPEVLILDEATTALDVSIQKDIIELIMNIQKERNLAILFITHDFSIVNLIAHNVCVMRKGVIVENGTKESVLHNPQNEYTRRLIACVPKLGDTRRRLPNNIS